MLDFAVSMLSAHAASLSKADANKVVNIKAGYSSTRVFGALTEAESVVTWAGPGKKGMPRPG